MASPADRKISVEVAYARPDRQFVVKLQVAPDTLPAAAVRTSGILATCPEIDPERAHLGIWGRPLKNPSTPLQPGDRVEIYRPLPTDPKTARILRTRRPRG